MKLKSFMAFLGFLVILGALNWGLIGLFNFNLVTFLLPGSWVKLAYCLIGLGGLVELWYWIKENF